MRSLSLALLALLSLSACKSGPDRIFKYDKELMHTRWDFSFVCDKEEKAHDAFEAAAAEVERLDKVLAMWMPDSEVAAFNQKAGQGPQKVSEDLDQVLSFGDRISRLSDGASDCTVGPLVQLWYESLKKKQLPSKAAIDKANALVDYHHLKREGDRLWSSTPGTIVDLGSLAKGFAQDKAAAIIRKRGFKSFVMNAGGQVYAAGHKPDGSKWRIGLVNPRNVQKMVTVLELEDVGMSTSGDYEQFTIIKGKRYHHIMDPRTGMPTTNHVASVSVLIPLKGKESMPGAWIDSVDTAALVMGVEKGQAMLNGEGLGSIILSEGKGKTLEAHLSPGLVNKFKLDLTY